MPRGTTPEQRRARNIQGEQWDKENTKQVKFKFNLRTDADILARLAEEDILGGLALGNGRILWCTTEVVSKAELDKTAALVKEVLA